MDRQVNGGYPDVFSVTTVARREDDLPGRTGAEGKSEIDILGLIRSCPMLVQFTLTLRPTIDRYARPM
jgi:hypothetical protein